MEIELYKIGDGYGFNIIQNGTVICNQPTDTTSGNDPMTYERALEFGEEMLLRLAA